MVNTVTARRFSLRTYWSAQVFLCGVCVMSLACEFPPALAFHIYIRLISLSEVYDDLVSWPG